jgi:hypothetical protein
MRGRNFDPGKAECKDSAESPDNGGFSGRFARPPRSTTGHPGGGPEQEEAESSARKTAKLIEGLP